MAGGDQGRDSDGDADAADSDVEGALRRLTTKGSPAANAAADEKGRKGAGAKPPPGPGRAGGSSRPEKASTSSLKSNSLNLH